MSNDSARAERLAEQRYPGGASEDYLSHAIAGVERAAYVTGYLASKVLTEDEWAEKREEVARAIFARQFPGSSTTMDPLESLEANAPYYYADADAAMIALGFTRTSEPGGDTC